MEKENPLIYCWGQNEDGQLALGDKANEQVFSPTPNLIVDKKGAKIKAKQLV